MTSRRCTRTAPISSSPISDENVNLNSNNTGNIMECHEPSKGTSSRIASPRKTRSQMASHEDQEEEVEDDERGDANLVEDLEERLASEEEKKTLSPKEQQIMLWIIEFSCQTERRDLMEVAMKILPEDEYSYPPTLRMKLKVLELIETIEGPDFPSAIVRVLQLFEEIRPDEFGNKINSPSYLTMVHAIVRAAVCSVDDEEEFQHVMDVLQGFGEDIDGTDMDARQKRKLHESVVDRLNRYHSCRGDDNSSEFRELEELFLHGKYSHEAFLTTAHNYITSCESKLGLGVDCFLSAVAAEVSSDGDEIPERLSAKIQSLSLSFDGNLSESAGGGHVEDAGDVATEDETEAKDSDPAVDTAPSVEDVQAGESSAYLNLRGLPRSLSVACITDVSAGPEKDPESEEEDSEGDCHEESHENRPEQDVKEEDEAKDRGDSVDCDKAADANQSKEDESGESSTVTERPNDGVSKRPAVNDIAKTRRANARRRDFEDPIVNAVEVAKQASRPNNNDDELQSPQDEKHLSRRRSPRNKEKGTMKMDYDADGVEEAWESDRVTPRMKSKRNRLRKGSRQDESDSDSAGTGSGSSDDSYTPGQADWDPEEKTRRRRSLIMKTKAGSSSRRSRAAKDEDVDGSRDTSAASSSSDSELQRRHKIGKKQKTKLKSSFNLHKQRPVKREVASASEDDSGASDGAESEVDRSKKMHSGGRKASSSNRHRQGRVKHTATHKKQPRSGADSEQWRRRKGSTNSRSSDSNDAESKKKRRRKRSPPSNADSDSDVDSNDVRRSRRSRVEAKKNKWRHKRGASGVASSEESESEEAEPAAKSPPSDEQRRTKTQCEKRALPVSPEASSAESTPNEARKKRRSMTVVGTSESERRYRRWTPEEVEMLCKGVKLYGKGAWASIRNHFAFPEYRTAVHLKDKWRNLN